MPYKTLLPGTRPAIDEYIASVFAVFAAVPHIRRVRVPKRYASNVLVRIRKANA